MREVQLERKKREEAGYTLRQLAEKLGMRSTASLSKYEASTGLHVLGVLVRLAEILGYDLSRSLNYKFFHGRINVSRFRERVARCGLDYLELSKRINFADSQAENALNMTQCASLECLSAIMSYLLRQSAAMSKVSRPEASHMGEDMRSVELRTSCKSVEV